LGETVIETGERIYIFASVLSASRFRYVAVQNRPFKTLDVVLHLLDCFEYIGGIPEEIVIDQDSTLVVSENHGTFC
jgi:transposase